MYWLEEKLHELKLDVDSLVPCLISILGQANAVDSEKADLMSEHLKESPMLKSPSDLSSLILQILNKYHEGSLTKPAVAFSSPLFNVNAREFIPTAQHSSSLNPFVQEFCPSAYEPSYELLENNIENDGEGYRNEDEPLYEQDYYGEEEGEVSNNGEIYEGQEGYEGYEGYEGQEGYEGHEGYEGYEGYEVGYEGAYEGHEEYDSHNELPYAESSQDDDLSMEYFGLNEDEYDEFDPFSELQSNFVIGETKVKPLEILESIFPDIPQDQIEKVFMRCEYDMNESLNVLLGKKVIDEPVTGANLKKEVSKKVCRYFLSGACHRKDCMYSHSVESRLCKYWIKGNCLKGTSCEFAHSITPLTHLSPSKLTLTSPLAQASFQPTDFPALPTNKPTVALPYAGYSDFPLLPSSKPPTRLYPTPLPPTFSVIASKNPGRASSNTSLPKSRRLARRPPAYLKQPVPLPWLATGTPLHGLYQRTRARALALGRTRSRIFQQSSGAYHRGDGALAKVLADKARELTAQLHELHEEAAKKIFEARNQNLNSSAGRLCFIDLHGLHPDEAIRFLEEKVKVLEREVAGKEGGNCVCYVIVGTGHHSKGGRRVGEGINEWLEEREYLFAETSIAEDKYHRGGVFAVQI